MANNDMFKTFDFIRLLKIAGLPSTNKDAQRLNSIQSQMTKVAKAWFMNILKKEYIKPDDRMKSGVPEVQRLIDGLKRNLKRQWGEPKYIYPAIPFVYMDGIPHDFVFRQDTEGCHIDLYGSMDPLDEDYTPLESHDVSKGVGNKVYSAIKRNSKVSGKGNTYFKLTRKELEGMLNNINYSSAAPMAVAAEEPEYYDPEEVAEYEMLELDISAAELAIDSQLEQMEVEVI